MADNKNELSNVYQPVVDDIKEIIEKGRNNAYSSVNSIMIMTYWNIGRRIVEEEQRGQERAQYGTKLLKYLSEQLQQTYGRGFSERYLAYFRKFYLTVPNPEILQTRLQNLSWSHIMTTLRVEDEAARRWYLTNASTQGWSVKQLSRNISTQYYEEEFSNSANFDDLTSNTDSTETITKLEEAHGAVYSQNGNVYTFSDGYEYTLKESHSESGWWNLDVGKSLSGLSNLTRIFGL